MHNKPRLKGLPSEPVQTPIQWCSAMPDNDNKLTRVGHHENWGWILSPGLVPHTLEDSSPVHAKEWILRSHEWLEANKKGPQQGLDILPAWQHYIQDAFFAKYPEFNKPGIPAMRRPWIDAGVIQIKRTRSGIEVRYCCTSMIAIGIHSGINDIWLIPQAFEWHRQHFAKHKPAIQKQGIFDGDGKKEVLGWHTYCRQSINQQGGFSGWVLGDPLLRGWTSGRLHVSDTPFTVSVCNLGVLAASDIYQLYPTHKEIFDYLRTHKRMDVFVDRLREREKEDLNAIKYPRAMPQYPLAILTASGE